MPRSNVVLTCQTSPHMKLPQVHHSYQSSIHQHTSSASLSHSTASDLHSSPDHFVQHSYVPNHTQTHDHQQLHPFVKNEQQVALPNLIPNSVKGAPAHLRPAIRKRQNSESAKRSRQRRKEAAKIFYRRFDEQCRRLSALEQKVATLLQLVKETDEDRTSEPRTKQEDEIVPVQTPNHCVDQCQPIAQTDSDRSQGQASSIVQTMAAMSTAYEEEQQDNRAPQIPFEDDIEAFLDTCIHSQAPMFGSC